MQALALLVIVLLAIWLQEFIYSRYAFHNLEYDCQFSVPYAFEGDEITLVEVVHNNKPLPLQWLKVEIRTSRWLSYAQSRSTIAQETRSVTSGYFLRFYQKTTRIWKVKCLKRGAYSIENLTIVSSDLFGLTTCSKHVRVNTGVLVFPGIIDLDDMLLTSKSYHGNTIVKRWIVDDPFIIAGAREYISGDPMSKIDWQATARQGNLMVRKNDYTANESLRVILNIQTVEYYHPETIDKELIEYGIKIAASIFDRALSRGISTSLATNGYIPESCGTVFTDSGSGSTHAEDLLTLLAKLTFKITIGFDDYLDKRIPDITDSQVIMITAYLDEALENCLIRLRERGSDVQVILLDEKDVRQVG